MSNTQKHKWPGCNYKCKHCGHVKFIITNTFQTEIWERCTDDCSWSGLGEKGPAIPAKDGSLTNFHKRRYQIDRSES